MRQCVTPTPVSPSVRMVSWREGIVCLLFLLLFNLSYHVIADESLSDIQDTMTWPLLPGESVSQLATLFYPNNKPMQQVFIKQTLSLSQELHPQLSANKAADQVISIIVPDLKALSKQGGGDKPKASKLQMAHQMGEKSIAIVTEAMWREYEALKQSNQLLSENLEKLHTRLDKLQVTLNNVKEAAQNFLKKQTAQLAQSQPAEPIAKAAEEKKPAPALVKTEEPIRLAQANTKHPALEASAKNTGAWWQLPMTTLIPIGLFALILAFFYGLSRYRFKHIGDELGSQQIIPIDWPDTEIKPSEDSFNPDETMPYIALIHPDTLLSSSESLAQARILSGSGRPKAAVELLEAVIATQPDESLEAWLYLLDLYREMGLKTEFIEYAQRLHTSFNVVTPQWEIKEVALVMASSLEEFPHIIEELSQHWKDGSAQDFLAGLLKDNREGERAGFSIPVLQEIMLLQAILKIRE